MNQNIIQSTYFSIDTPSIKFHQYLLSSFGNYICGQMDRHDLPYMHSLMQKIQIKIAYKNHCHMVQIFKNLLSITLTF